jgi:hypothetical protein
MACNCGRGDEERNGAAWTSWLVGSGVLVLFLVLIMVLWMSARSRSTANAALGVGGDAPLAPSASSLSFSDW